jgi:preprotein translocase subunit SecG
MADAPKRSTRDSLLIFLLYVGAAIGVVLLQPRISLATGMSAQSVALAAAAVFFAISIVTAIARKKRNNKGADAEPPP